MSRQLIEFNVEIWHSWIIQGYKFLECVKIDNGLILRPTNSELEMVESGYFLPITDPQILEMTSPIELLRDFKFLCEF